jgi:hypothetical protein
MADQVKVTRAELRELKADGTEVPGSRVAVQFNPETLRVVFANQIVQPHNSNAAGDQRGTSTTQFVGKGTTKLTVQLWFDVTSVLPEGKETVADVRELTRQVAYFITPKPSEKDPQMDVPPGVRFLWGSFQFDGIMDSLEESLDYFSPEGKPLRASVTLSLSQQKIEFNIRPLAQLQPQGTRTPSGAAPGTSPLAQARFGATLQGMAASLGKGDDWRTIAEANNIENPRLLRPGQLIDMNATAARARRQKGAK